MNNFHHKALEDSQLENRKLVYTAMPKELFYMRLFITKYVLENDAVPLNPFTNFDYFLLDTVDRDTIRRANNSLVRNAHEIWTFGSVSDGVLAESIQAKNDSKTTRHFTVQKDGIFNEIVPEEVLFDDEVSHLRNEFLRKL